MTERIQGYVGIALNGTPLDAGSGNSGLATIRTIEADDSPLATLSIALDNLNPLLPDLTTAIEAVTPYLQSLSVGPATAFTHVSAGVTEDKTVVSAAPTALRSLYVGNSGAAAAYLKLYDLAVAPDVTTDIPVLVYLVPAGTAHPIQLPLEGIDFAAGIGITMVTGSGNTNGTEVPAGEITVSGSYK